jgi:hypothetical protein
MREADRVHSTPRKIRLKSNPVPGLARCPTMPLSTTAPGDSLRLASRLWRPAADWGGLTPAPHDVLQLGWDDAV